MWCFLVILGVLCVATGQQTFRFRDVRVERLSADILIYFDGNDKPASIARSTSLRKDTQIKDCSDGADKLCLAWGKAGRLELNAKQTDCVEYFSSDMGDSSNELSYCIPYGEDQWFGGPERWLQDWPVQKLEIVKEPYVVATLNAQEIAEPYWLSSSGRSYYVHPYVPLFTDSNKRENNSLCLIAQNIPPYNPRNLTRLDFQMCRSDSMVEAHLWNVDNNLGKPNGIPDELMIKYPIFSTWARYKQGIDEKVVATFMQEIKDHGFPLSQLEIDDKWEPCYGSATFDTNKFPNIKNLTDSLHAAGARVTVWIYPFINEGCEPHFSQAKAEGRFVTNEKGEVMVGWWNGNGGAIDFTNSTTAQWWADRLRNLQKTAGIDSFKFDAGETSYLPSNPILNVTFDRYPNEYTTRYVEVASTFGSFIETRVMKGNQAIPTFVREADKDTRWNLSNGLQAVITSMLQMNIAGYSFVLPDMIGGNAYGNDKVSKELFIRWLQANTFMPTLQFSVVPWDFDNETVEISRKFVELHAQYADAIIAAARKTSENGTPLNPPIWWASPLDTATHPIRDEFLLGENLLVAPVVEEGAFQRDIYLPAGTWQEFIRPNGANITGPTWLRQYPVALDQLAYFKKLN